MQLYIPICFNYITNYYIYQYAYPIAQNLNYHQIDLLLIPENTHIISIKVILILISKRAQIKKYILVQKISNAPPYNGLILVKKSIKKNLKA